MGANALSAAKPKDLAAQQSSLGNSSSVFLKKQLQPKDHKESSKEKECKASLSKISLETKVLKDFIHQLSGNASSVSRSSSARSLRKTYSKEEPTVRKKLKLYRNAAKHRSPESLQTGESLQNLDVIRAA